MPEKLYKCVNGERIEMTQEEIAELQRYAEAIDNTVYHFGDYKEENGHMYRCIQDTVKNIPVINNMYWEPCDIASELNRLSNELKEVGI